MSDLLLIDDDQELCELLVSWLSQEGFQVRACHDGSSARKALSESSPDAVVLDVMLPDGSGLELLKQLRNDHPDLPVLMLSARGEPLDRILGLEMGADDYLPKPFEPRELLARIRSVLRRSHAMPSNVPSDKAQQIRFSGWTLDLTARHLLNPTGLVIMLSGAEFRLLRVFLEHPNRVLNRDQLLNLTQGRDADPFDRSIDIQISRLRQKLGEDARLPQIIKTVRNGGYVLAGQVNVEPHA